MDNVKKGLVVIILALGFLTPLSSVFAAVDISDVETREIRDVSAIILWHNETIADIPGPLTGQIDYGIDTSYGMQTAIDSSSFFHSISISGLTPSTTYHYRLRVKDSQGAETLSGDYVFSTVAAPLTSTVTGISPNESGDTIINTNTLWQGITATCGGNVTVGSSSGRIAFTIKDSVITLNGTMTMGGDTPVDFYLINSTIIFPVTGGAASLIDSSYIDGTKQIIVKDTAYSDRASRIELKDSTIRGTSATYRAGGVVIRSGYTGYANPITKHTAIIDNTTFADMGGLTSSGAGYWALNLRWWDGYDAEFASGSLFTHIRLVDDGKGARLGGHTKMDYAYAAGGACAFTDGRYYEHVYMDKVYEGLYEPDNDALVNHSWFDGNGTKFNFNTGSNGIFEYNYVQNAAFNAGDGSNGNSNIIRNNILYHTGIGSRKDYTQYLNNQIDSTNFEYGVNMGGRYQTASGNIVTGAVRYAFNVVPHPYTTLPAGWHEIRDNVVSGTQYGIRIASNTGGSLGETDNKFINNAINSTTVGWGISFQDSANQLFVNTKISNTAGRDIEFHGNNSNVKFINTYFNPTEVYIDNATDIFLPYSYLDVKVVDQNGNPVSGATLNIANEIDNANYTAIDIDGNSQSSFATDTQGYTPLPSDAGNSIAILDYAKTSSAETEMTYAVTASKNGKSVSATGINPTASWYRANPETHTNTVQLVLDLSSPSSTNPPSSGGGTTTILTPIINKLEVIKMEGNNITLNLNVTNASDMMLSDASSFTDVSWIAFSNPYTYTKKDNQEKLYLKFKSSTGTISSVYEFSVRNIGTATPSGNNEASPYPTGTLLKTTDSFKVYVMIDGKKKWIPTPQVFAQLGYKWTEIKVLTPGELEAIPDFEDNLIRALGNYKVYLVVNGVKRHIPNPEVFLNYGFAWNDVKDVPQETVDKYRSTYLIQEDGVSSIYYLRSDGIRKIIPTTSIFDSYNDKAEEDVQIISNFEMNYYPLSSLIKLGGNNDIYLIEGNLKKRITSPEVFNRLKLNWNFVMTVNQLEFDFYQNGGEIR